MPTLWWLLAFRRIQSCVAKVGAFGQEQSSNRLLLRGERGAGPGGEPLQAMLRSRVSGTVAYSGQAFLASLRSVRVDRDAAYRVARRWCHTDGQSLAAPSEGERERFHLPNRRAFELLGAFRVVSWKLVPLDRSGRATSSCSDLAGKPLQVMLRVRVSGTVAYSGQGCPSSLRSLGVGRCLPCRAV